MVQPVPVPAVLHAGVCTLPVPGLLLALGQQPDDPPQLAVEAGQTSPDEDQDKEPGTHHSVRRDMEIRRPANEMEYQNSI